MSTAPDPAESAGELAEWSARLDVIEDGVRAAAARARSAALTVADPSTGEQWEEGQVWAHMSEFVPYWVAQARVVVAGHTAAEDDSGEVKPTPFGRVKSDEVRVTAIAERRHDAVEELAGVVLTDIEILRGYLAELGDSAATWAIAGRHQTLGVMTMHDMFEEFLVGHLEQHLDQLDALAS